MKLPVTESSFFGHVRSTVVWVDRAMNRLIRIGGLAVIMTVFAIFIFIGWQILPLFKNAQVQEVQSLNLPRGDYKILGVDEWSEAPFLADASGALHFINLKTDQSLTRKEPGFLAGHPVSAMAYSAQNQTLVYGTGDGLVATVKVRYEAEFDDSGSRRIGYDIEEEPLINVGSESGPIIEIAQGDSGSARLLACIQDLAGVSKVSALVLERPVTLFGEGELQVVNRFELTSSIRGKPLKIRVNQQANAVLVLSDSQELYYFYSDGANLELKQVFKPFADLADSRVTQFDFLLGGVTLSLTGAKGENRLFSLFRPEGSEERLFGRIRDFKALGGPADSFASSLRNKAFVLAGAGKISLRYSTTGDIRWQKTLKGDYRLAALSGKYDRIFILDSDSRFHEFSLKDPHPEAGWKAFFGKIWYEGSYEPKYEWQSTGGTDEFEPKLSLVPMIIGSLKGTFYALLFALPIAILAALYTSQFCHPDIKQYIKPIMEIMASLPSVVLGFLAAIFLAPLIEDRIPSLILFFAGLPLTALGTGWVWQKLPKPLRLKVRPGCEFLVLIPVVLILLAVTSAAGPWVERVLFVARDSSTGAQVSDFRLWWVQTTGMAFEQRNSLVVGFIMGFAVIPIIFTIAEDALSNVPTSLKSASLALGASRWQTTLRVILPAASAGILSAVMIGFGRAVGETMIVVMATGNTPIMDFNIFSGMRTLSANIAVELPEAPYQGTLYRTLYLGAMVLFLMTFAVNTLAELLRERIRKKYQAV